jgi:hypothetical protein
MAALQTLLEATPPHPDEQGQSDTYVSNSVATGGIPIALNRQNFTSTSRWQTKSWCPSRGIQCP